MLTKIREKPHHIKQGVALALTSIIFCLILFVWVSSWDARNSGQTVRANTVSPLGGVTSMFDGFFSSFKEKMTAPATPANVPSTTATSSNTFDLSGVIIIDPSTSSGKSISASTTKAK